MRQNEPTDTVTRRSLLIGGLVAAGGTAVLASSAAGQQMLEHGMGAMPAPDPVNPYAAPSAHEGAHGQMMTVGRVDPETNGFDPTPMLTEWDLGTVTTMEDGRALRTFEVEASDKEIEIAPGVMFPAWTFNGRVPGPALRAKEGERLRIVFRNYGSHPHSMHFHGIHSWRMDGVPGAGLINPGEEFVYEFDAKPFGCHLYHCHALPLKRHMHKGMYGAFVIDPDPELHPEFEAVAKSRLLGTPENASWQELIMVMNAFDTNFDGANEFYAVNTIAHAYALQPIRIEKSRPVRIYLINVTEFDPINSFHLHANFFNYFDTGTTLTPTLRTVDLIMQCQAQRGILEFSYADHEAGQYMFHAHQAEFTELGWMGMFDVVED
ncbi:copper oxidase [Devosia limi DSM 17137]|uniref:Copper-containing nitrite reductase n=1 Tax=Devosia limi DSM 17137 TaxID=1121477 RepID=A0A0F5LQP7_9HYPH|nr:multicopper oxidase domain-containing protein [Devosia limi]KKB84685.1 copper oxidase [Devosia limi DSM 17137]SHF54301.1 Multicopper oxidase with three cupredoxin domains (includes cell division protein FtsP and spore coat protein CotA) [Devosia limi DSM 17137]